MLSFKVVVVCGRKNYKVKDVFMLLSALSNQEKLTDATLGILSLQM